eukprot:scaffold164343_cov27-Tisochrysis_lutea.AAC.1
MGKKASSPPVRLEPISPGDGRTFPRVGDSVTVHYTGTLLNDGSEFDSSREKGVPFTFGLGSGAVIRGWDLAIGSMSLGQRAKLFINADAAYGRKGFVDKQNASGTGIIPPNADLVFDVEILDINDCRGIASDAKLAVYRKKLTAWVDEKLDKFDRDSDFASKQTAKHGSRDGFYVHLKSQIEGKLIAEADRMKQSARTATALVVADMLEKGGLDSAAQVDATGSTDSRGKPVVAKEAATLNSHALAFDSRFASVKVEPNPGEQSDANFPRNLHNAAELFAAHRMQAQAAALHCSADTFFSLLAAGPTGRQSQRLGRACICWDCGHAGLPTNAAKVAETGSEPRGICSNCGDSTQTNFLRVVQADGAVVPWIEDAEEQQPVSTASLESPTA